MEQITSHRQYRIARTIPNRNLWGELKRFGLQEFQVKFLLGRYEMSDLRSLLERVKKSGFINLPALYLKLVGKELRKKKPKPRQRKLRI